MSHPPVSQESLQQALADLFAPWVQALGLQVESFGADEVTLPLPQSDQLARVGGILCGQAMMAAADSAMVLARNTLLPSLAPLRSISPKARLLPTRNTFAVTSAS